MTLSAILTDCDTPVASARFLVFPVAENTRTYGNGDVRFLHLDTFGEPAGGSSRIMILVRRRDTAGFHCSLATINESVGFSDVDLANARSSYDAHTGLTVEVPVRAFDGDAFRDFTLVAVVRIGAGEVTVELRDGRC